MGEEEKSETKKSFTQKRFYLLGELWSYMKTHKKWWLLPIIALLVLAAILIWIGQGSAISPFIYALI